MAMTNEEAIASLNATNDTLAKVSSETDALLTEIKRLEEALANAGGSGGTITPELEQAVQAVSSRAASIDALVEDVSPPET